MVKITALRMRKDFSFYSTLLFIVIWSALIVLQLKTLHHALFKEGSLIQFYPLIFLPLFCSKRAGTFTLFDYLQIAGCFIVLLISKAGGISTGIWLAAVWLGLTLLKGTGLPIHLFGKLLFLLIPPFNAKYTLVFGFSLRLFLTNAAGRILSLIDPTLITEGNLITFMGNDYIVDPACEGLKMGIALIIMIMVFFYKVYPYLKLSVKSFCIYTLSVLFFGILWLFANLLRIVILVFGNIGPDSAAHSIAGIIIFVSVVFFPLYLLKEALTGDEKDKESADSMEKKTKYNPLIILTSITLFWAALLFIRLQPAGTAGSFPDAAGPFILKEKIDTESSFGKDYTIGTYTYPGKDISLVIKDNLFPLRIIHHPRQCWEGLGYRIVRENFIFVSPDSRVNYALLEKDKKQYHLYWWYQSSFAFSQSPTGVKMISSEVKWRKDYYLKGIKYYQFNLFYPAELADSDIVSNLVRGLLQSE